MVSKALVVALVAVPIVLIGAYLFIAPFEVTQVPVAPTLITDMSDLIGNLEAEGVPLEREDGGVVVRGMPQPFFSVDAQVLKMHDEDVQVFEYSSQSDAQADMALVTPEGQFRTVQVSWVDTPHFYHTERLIVLYVGNNEDIINTLEDLLGPQFAGG